MGAMTMAMFIIVIPGILSLNALWVKTDELQEAQKGKAPMSDWVPSEN